MPQPDALKIPTHNSKTILILFRDSSEETENVTKYKRKKVNFRVKKEFQIWLLGRIMGMVFFSSIVAAGILYFYARGEMADSFYDAHIKIRRVSDLLIPVIAAGSLVSFICGTLLAIFIPQKIAGPLFRIEKNLHELKDGDLTVSFQLRKEDILQDFANTVNDTAISLNSKVQDVKKTQEVLEKAIAENNVDMTLQTLKQQKGNLEVFKT